MYLTSSSAGFGVFELVVENLEETGQGPGSKLSLLTPVARATLVLTGFPPGQDARIEFFDAQGRRVWEAHVRAESAEPVRLLLPPHLSAGVYFLRVSGPRSYGPLKFLRLR